MPGEFEHEAAEAEFWDLISAQIVQALDEFARQQARAGADQTFFTGEAVKGLRLVELMLREYDVVVTNPPYSGKRNLNDLLAAYLDKEYPDAKGDLYAAFIQRCGELVAAGGRLGMITQQSFMFLSSYEKLRARLRERFAIETMAHVGPRAFAEISGEKVNTTVFALRAEADAARRDGQHGHLFPAGQRGRKATASAWRSSRLCRSTATSTALPSAASMRSPAARGCIGLAIRFALSLRHYPSLVRSARPRQGLATADNLSIRPILVGGRKARSSPTVEAQQMRRPVICDWYPTAKGSRVSRGGTEAEVVNWKHDGKEIRRI